MRRLVWVWALVVAAGLGVARAENSQSMNCGSNDGPLTTHDYERGSGDVVEGNRMEILRPFAENGRMEVQVCDADVRVHRSREGKEVHLTVELGSGGGGHSMADFIHTLRIAPDHGVIRLKFPKEVHATVTLSLPMAEGSRSEISLGRGDLDLNAIGSAGRREINVGMGHMRLHVDGDKSYSSMEVNVGMGSLHDYRPGGENGHFVVSKEYRGAGAGSIEVNVGMGSLEIRND